MARARTAFSNAFVEIRVGNVESRIVGPAPIESLERALNSRGLSAGVAEASDTGDAGDTAEKAEKPEKGLSTSQVFDPTSGVFLSGALPEVKRVLRRSGVRFRLRDRRSTIHARQGWCLRGPPLRDYQEEVVKEAVARGRGLIDIGVGGGKSLLAAAVVAAIGLPCIWLVTTRALLSQTVRNVREFLGVEPGVIGDGECRPTSLTVALVQSLWSREIDLTAWRGGTLVFDEGHHAAAKTYRETIQRIEPRYHYYLSAVPFRSTRGEQAVLEALAGRPLTGRKYCSRFLVERGYCSPVEVRAERVSIAGEMAEKPFGRIYREFIVLNSERNQRIARISEEYLRAGRQVLVLVEQVRHGEELLRLIGEGACFVHGETPRRVLLERIAAFAGRQVRCLLATSPLLHEGVDIRGIEVVVAAGGLRSKAKVIQSLGRGMRLAPGKRCCTYVDFLDDDVGGILRAHARERFRVLKEEGFYVPPLAEEPERSGDAEGEIPPTWWHLPGSRSFFLVDGAGRVHGKAYCMKKERVPAQLCKRCKGAKVCEKGGMILWQEK
jgi:superfamily II DNA or RNA helicase